MRGLLVKFVIVLLLTIAIVFALHLWVLHLKELPLYDNKIILSYGLNALLALLIFAGIYFFIEKVKNQVGFLFMAGSFLKFAVFFIVLFPIYKQDGEINTIEFMAFFIPYVASLTIETIGVSLLLKKIDETNAS